MKIVFLAEIRNGSISFVTEANTARFKDWAKQNTGKKIRIEEELKPVSQSLRGYYFSAVIPVLRSTCEEWKHLNGEELHNVIKKMLFYFETYNPITKRTERFGRSVMSEDEWNNTKKASEFLEIISNYLADCGREMPDSEAYIRWRDSAPMLNEK